MSYLCNGEWLGEYFVGGHNLTVTQPGADLWRVDAQQLHHDGQVFVLHLQQARLCAHVRAGDISFVVAAATLWNALPNNIKTSACLATFKACLHTFLSDSSHRLA